jgi:hypothetical protein
MGRQPAKKKLAGKVPPPDRWNRFLCFFLYSSTILALVTPGTAHSFFMIPSDAI